MDHSEPSIGDKKEDGILPETGAESAVESEAPEITDPEKDVPDARPEQTEWRWENDAYNPYNWPKWKKNIQLGMAASVALASSIGTSIVSPAHNQMMQEFGISSTVAFLPLSLYVLALGLGPIVGGPLSETAGRQTVWVSAVLGGGLFAMGSGLSPTFAGLCVMRFLSGFFYGPALAIGSGVISETYLPIERATPSALYILSPFLGPGLGPVIGVFLVDRQDWRWTQYTLAFFAAYCCLWLVVSRETYHPVIQRRRMKQLDIEAPPSPPFSTVLRTFLTVGLLRPLRMMLTEPIVAYLSLYIACMFGTLFIFFSAFFYVFEGIYHFTLEQAGLVFLGIALGCIIGVATVGVCDRLFYRRKAKNFPLHKTPPEYRLYPAMLGSLLLPVSLFWFGWSARSNVNAAVPIIAVVLFGWGNITLFISSMQYLGDTYHRTNVASAASANSLARYSAAAGFPFFSLQMYENLGIGWATSILGLVALVLLPGPWVLFRYGKRIRDLSKYETASY